MLSKFHQLLHRVLKSFRWSVSLRLRSASRDRVVICMAYCALLRGKLSKKHLYATLFRSLVARFTRWDIFLSKIKVSSCYIMYTSALFSLDKGSLNICSATLGSNYNKTGHSQGLHLEVPKVSFVSKFCKLVL